MTPVIHNSFILAMVLLYKFTADTAPVQTELYALKYLSKFGYLPPANDKPDAFKTIFDPNTITGAIQNFQKFVGANVSGEFDGETLEFMSIPRCDIVDDIDFGTGTHRMKRYIVQESHWGKKQLTYKILKYPKKLKMADVDAEISKAFKIWSDYTDLTLSAKETGQVDIEIQFVEGYHGDNLPFNRKGALAHAFFPESNGSAHFNDAIDWTINSTQGINLLYAAAHEFGHSLGLRHSEETSSLMAPLYRGFNPFLKLHPDDVLGIQAIYGNLTNQEVENTPTEKSYDSVSQFWRFDPLKKTVSNYSISMFGGLPNKIDAALYTNSSEYFFKAYKYYTFNERTFSVYNDNPAYSRQTA